MLNVLNYSNKSSSAIPNKGESTQEFWIEAGMGKVFFASCWEKAVSIEHSCGCQVTFQARVRELCAPAQVEYREIKLNPSIFTAFLN